MRILKWLALGPCFISCLGPLGTPQEESEDSGRSKIVVQNLYWANEGMVDAVYRHRLYASEVRRRLGLAVGRVLRRTSDSDELPDVIWECEYPNMEARDRDLAELNNSGEFEPVMEKMGTMIRKFDRGVWRVETESVAREQDR